MLEAFPQNIGVTYIWSGIKMLEEDYMVAKHLVVLVKVRSYTDLIGQQQCSNRIRSPAGGTYNKHSTKDKSERCITVLQGDPDPRVLSFVNTLVKC